MRRLAHVIVGIGATCALVVGSSRAASAATGGALWTVDVKGHACASQRAALEREITLACSAVGGTCGLARSASEAELRAVLDCADDTTWTLETSTVEGAPIDRVELVGSVADRVREAGVQIARDAAPERALAVESLKLTLSDEDRPRPTTLASRVFALAVGGRLTSGTGDAPAMGGARATGGLALWRRVRATAGMTAELGGSGPDAMRLLRPGIGIAVGAPYDHEAVLGVAVEGGLAFAQTYRPITATDHTLLASVGTTQGYGQGAVVLQVPGGAFRPFLGVSAVVLTAEATILSTAELGLAVSVF